MSEREEVLKALNVVLAAAFADKIYASHLAHGADLVRKVHAGELTVNEAYEQAKFKDGDALDQALSG